MLKAYENDWLEQMYHGQHYSRMNSLKSDEEEFEMCEGDWLERMYQLQRDSLVGIWNIQWCVYLSLHSDEKGLRIHIRRYGEGAHQKILPTREGVVMTSATWCVFAEKMKHFNCSDIDSSFIANNQLSVFSNDGFSILHQVFRNDPAYEMKALFIKLCSEQVRRLNEISGEISDCIRVTMFQSALPLALKKCRKCQTSYHIEDGREQLMQHLKEGIQFNVSKMYKCCGCISNSDSQADHECLTISYKEKQARVGHRALLSLNIRKIAKELRQNFCTCPYTKEFFNNVKVEDYMKFFEI